MTHKILIVSAMYTFGGTERSTQRLITLLKKNNFDVSLASDLGPIAKQLIAEGINHYHINTHPKGLLSFLASVKNFFKILRTQKFDLIHIQMAYTVPIIKLAALLAGQPNVPIIWHSRGILAATYSKVVCIFRFLKIYMLGNCLHEFNKLKKYGANEYYLSYMYNMMPFIRSVKDNFKTNVVLRDKLECTSDTILIGSISRLSKLRAVDHVITVAQQVSKTNKNVKFVIVGDGPEQEALEKQAASLISKKIVHFIGSSKEIHNIYSNINIIIHSPLLHGDTGAGTGNIPIEAALYKVPIISYDGIGISEIVINEKTGYLVKTGDIKGLIDATMQAIENPELNRVLVQNANKLVKQLCDEDVYLDRIKEIYKQCIKGCPLNKLNHTYVQSMDS